MKTFAYSIFLFITINFAPIVGFSQDTQPTIPQIETISALFTAQHIIVLERADSLKWGTLTDNEINAFQTHAEEILKLTENHRNFDAATFRSNYIQYNGYSRRLFKIDEYNSIIRDNFTNPVIEILFELFDKDLKEYFHRVDVRYGKYSEKLNLLEVAINNALFSPRTTGSQINYPKVPELILRAQSVGYQYYGESSEFLPSSPIFQIGFSLYLYGDSKFEKWANHIGLAAAYEYDLVTKTPYFGGMFHIRNFDIGLLYDPENKQQILATSFNVQLIKGVF